MNQSTDFNIQNRASFSTVAELQALLSNAKDSASITICDFDGWFFLATDYSYARLDYEEADDIVGYTFPLLSIGELRYLLNTLPRDLPVSVCDLSAWFHASKDFSRIGFYDDALDDYYEEVKYEL